MQLKEIEISITRNKFSKPHSAFAPYALNRVPIFARESNSFFECNGHQSKKLDMLLHGLFRNEYDFPIFQNVSYENPFLKAS